MAGGEAIVYLNQENLRYRERDRPSSWLCGWGEAIVYLIKSGESEIKRERRIQDLRRGDSM